MTQARDNLVTAVMEFLDEENCAAFSGHISGELFIAIGSKENIIKLMEECNGNPQS